MLRSLTVRPAHRSRICSVALMALCIAGCDDASEPGARTLAPPEEESPASSRITWLGPDSHITPAQWLASRAKKSVLPRHDARVETVRKELVEAARQFGEEPRMIANRAVQLEEMLAERGIDESATDLIEALMPLGSTAGPREGFGTVVQHYFNLRKQGVDKRAAIERLELGRGSRAGEHSTP